MLAEQLDRAHDDVVEVERVVVLEQRLIALVRARDDLAEVVVDGRSIGHRRRQLALGARDRREDRARREALRIDGQLLDDALHQRHLVGVVEDREPALDADGRAVGAQDARADGVERAEHDVARLVAEQVHDAVAHLARRLVRERDGDDAVGMDVLDCDQVGDAVRDHARLAAARPGEDQQRPLRVLDRFLLGRVEFGEQVHRGGSGAFAPSARIIARVF